MRCIGKILLLITITLLGSTVHVTAAENENSVLVEMFQWWNQAFIADEAFNETGFAQYYTDDIVFIINGRTVARDIKTLTERFNKIKNRYYQIEIILPMIEEFRSGNKIFTYHLNHGKTEKDGPWTKNTHVMGWVELRDNKIKLLNLLHYNEPPKD